MSAKPDDRVNLKRNFNSHSSDTEGGERDSSSNAKQDYYNLNIATFTFGGRGAQMPMPLHSVEEKESLSRENNYNSSNNNQAQVNNFRKYNTIKKYSSCNEVPQETEKKSYISKDNYSSHQYTSFALSTIINKIGSHNSFLGVTIHSLFHLKHFRNFLLNEISLNEKDQKYKLLNELQIVMNKYSQNKKVDVSKLRVSLAEGFTNRRKFLLDQPEDPVDCLFVFLNAVHSYSMKHPINEVIDTMCTSKCLPHRLFWIDLSRIDECECKATSKRFYSNHNYIFDIPLDKLFELSNNINLVEMSKSFKLKSGKFSEVGSTEMSTVSDLKGKLFLYFKMLLNSIKVDCPGKGIRCEINKTNKNFYLNNFPTYLNFNLQRVIAGGSCNGGAQVLSIFEILKTFVLIPKIFDLGTLFDHSSKQKVFFEFFGAILIKPSKTYSCFFKNTHTTNTSNSSSINDYLYIHYDDDKITNFSSQFDLISYCLKNSEVPVLLFYQIQEKYNDSEKDISLDELQILERYARNADNLNYIISNRFRSNEDIIRFDKVDSANSHSQGLFTRNPSNASTLPLNQSSKNSSSISTSKPSSTNNSNSRIDPVTEYACINCYSKNRIECPVCLKCNKNNEAAIEDLLKKRNNMNYINIANFNLNINTGVEVQRERESISNTNINTITNLNRTESNNTLNVSPHTIPGRPNLREDNTRDSKNSSLKKASASGINSIVSNPFVPVSIVNLDKKSLNTLNTIGTCKYHDNEEDSDQNEDDYRKGNVGGNKEKSTTSKPKNYNMPKQIVTKKENPVVMKNLTIPTDPGENTNVVRTNSKKVFSPASNQNVNNNSIKNESQNQNISKQSNSISPDKPISVPSRPSTGKKNISLEDKNNYEDRITPFDMQRSKSKKSITTVTTLVQGNTINSINKEKNNSLTPDNWICDYCNSINKPYEYKCRDCKKTNSMQKEILDSLASHSNTGQNHNSSLKSNINSNPSSNYNTIKSPSKDNDKKSSHYGQYTSNTLEKKSSEKRLSSANPHSNYVSHQAHQEKKNCICYSNYNDTVIKNNICSLCNRYVENHGDSIKKKYQPQDLKTNVCSNNSHSSLPRKTESVKPSGNPSSSNQTKFRSPSSNQTPAKPRASTINRYKDVYVESQEDDSHLKNKERLSIGNNASKLNSTIKKRPEVTINTNTITYSSKPKK